MTKLPHFWEIKLIKNYTNYCSLSQRDNQFFNTVESGFSKPLGNHKKFAMAKF